MFDTRIRHHIDPVLDAIGQFLAAKRITANAITLSGFVIGVAAAVSIAMQFYLSGMVLLVISRLFDGLDGAVARATEKTDFGGFLDIVLDFSFYGMIPLAFIIANPEANFLAGSVLLLTFYVNGASFLTYALMAEKRGLTGNQRGSKSLLYTTGLAEATETIIVFILFCLFPHKFSLIAWVFAAVVFYTTVSRFMLARDDFKD